MHIGNATHRNAHRPSRLEIFVLSDGRPTTLFKCVSDWGQLTNKEVEGESLPVRSGSAHRSVPPAASRLVPPIENREILCARYGRFSSRSRAFCVLVEVDGATLGSPMPPDSQGESRTGCIKTSVLPLLELADVEIHTCVSGLMGLELQQVPRLTTRWEQHSWVSALYGEPLQHEPWYTTEPPQHSCGSHMRVGEILLMRGAGCSCL